MTNPGDDRLSEVVLDASDATNATARELCRAVMRFTEGETRFHELREEVQRFLLELERDEAWNAHIRRSWTYVSDSGPSFEVATGSGGGRTEGADNILIVRFTTAEAKSVMHAVERAKCEFGTARDAIALQQICAAYVVGKPSGFRIP